jgi:hypothetical protein
MNGTDGPVHRLPGQRPRKAPAEPGLDALLPEHAESDADGDAGQQEPGGVGAEVEERHELGHDPSVGDKIAGVKLRHRHADAYPPSSTYPTVCPQQHNIYRGVMAGQQYIVYGD